MRILYFADIRFPLERANGIQTMETCYALAELGHDVRLVVKPDTQVPPRDPFDYYGLRELKTLRIEQAVVTGPGRAQRVSYVSFAIGRAFGRRRADIAFTRDLGVASMLLRLPRSKRPPIVYESHGYAPGVAEALPRLIETADRPSAAKLKRLERREARVWKKAEGYVTITAGLLKEMADRFGPRANAIVAADGVRVPSKPPSPIPAEPVVAYAGHLYRWKGVDLLLDALTRVPDAKGLIVGGHEREPDLAREVAMAARLGIDARVGFMGMVPPPRVPELLAKAAILVLPNPPSAISTNYTSPLKLFEYMAAGRAIVATDLPSVREVLHHEVDALLVPADDAAALSAAIRRLLDDRALAQRLADAAFAAVPQYSWANRAKRLESLFKAIPSA